MKILKAVLMVKNMIARNRKAKAKSRQKNLGVVDHTDAKHPAEFLVRW